MKKEIKFILENIENNFDNIQDFKLNSRFGEDENIEKDLSRLKSDKHFFISSNLKLISYLRALRDFLN